METESLWRLTPNWTIGSVGTAEIADFAHGR